MSFGLDSVGNPTIFEGMANGLTVKKRKDNPTVVEEYDVAADAKKRISLRHADAKYFRVMSLSNGSYLLEPRVLVPRHAVSRRVLKMLDQSAENLKKGLVSAPIDLTAFLEE